MQERNDRWLENYSLHDSRYDWSFDDTRLVFTSGAIRVSADICMIGSVSTSKGTFLWAWANEAIPPQARRGSESVRAFGELHGLALLTTPEWSGGRADGLEMACVAGRVLDASGVWVDSADDVILFFALSHFQRL
jgi:hypothetical protein